MSGSLSISKESVTLPLPYLGLKEDGEKKRDTSEMWADVPFVFSLRFFFLPNDVSIRINLLEMISECQNK